MAVEFDVWWFHHLWNDDPGDRHTVTMFGDRRVMVCGVRLVNRIGEDRPVDEILLDIEERTRYLSTLPNIGFHLSQLEELRRTICN